MNKIAQIKSYIAENQKLRTFFNELFHSENNTKYLLKEGVAKNIEVYIDTIDDTLDGMDAFTNYEESGNGSYLFLYGILQLLVVNQDVIKYLHITINKICESNFNFEKASKEYKFSQKLKDIRELRNQIIGHPADKDKGKSEKTTGQVVRACLGHYKFKSIITKKGTLDTTYQEHDLSEVLINHLQETSSILKEIIRIIKKNKNLDFTDTKPI